MSKVLMVLAMVVGVAFASGCSGAADAAQREAVEIEGERIEAAGVPIRDFETVGEPLGIAGLDTTPEHDINIEEWSFCCEQAGGKVSEVRDPRTGIRETFCNGGTWLTFYACLKIAGTD